MDNKELEKNIEAEETEAEAPEKKTKKKAAAPVYDERTTMDAADVIAARRKARTKRRIRVLIILLVLASIIRFLLTDIDFIMKTYFRFSQSGMESAAEYMLSEDADLTHISTTEGNESYVLEHNFPIEAAKGINRFFNIMKVPYIDRAEDMVFFHVDGRQSDESFNIYNKNYSDYFYCYTEAGEDALTEYLEQDVNKIPFEIRELNDNWYVVVKLYKIKSDDTEGNYESVKERE